MSQEQIAERPSNVPPERVVDFDVYNPPGIENGFHEAWKSLQAPGIPDLVWTARNEGHWIVTRGALISRIFPDFDHFSNRIIVVPKSVGEQHQMYPTTMDPPIHRPFRLLLNHGLSPKAVRGVEPLVRQIAGELIDAFAARGHCNFTTEYAELLPVNVFLGLVDLPLEDAPKLRLWSDSIVHADGEMTYAQAQRAFHEYLEPYIARGLRGESDDVLSRIVRTDVDGRAQTHEEMLSVCMQLLLGGLDTVLNFLGFALLALARNPKLQAELAAQPELIPTAVEELLRRFPVVNVAREVRQDIELDGVQLKRGDVLMLPTSLVGNDERVNKCPMDVDIHRTTPKHATFGNGVHLCPGAHLARTETRVTIEEWLKRIPRFEPAPDSELRYFSGIVGAVKGLRLRWNPQQEVAPC